MAADPVGQLPAPPSLPLAELHAHTRARWRAHPAPWGWLPTLSVTSALGLLSVSAADALSRSGYDGAEPLFWLGLAGVVTPIVARLLAARAARFERLGLVLLLGLGLYLIRVMHSPFAFTYADEFVHQYNATQIAETGRLFSQNPILPATAFYPGLEAATAALMSLTGLSVFGAGLVLIGLARAVMMLALFLLFERVSGSARVAGIAGALYAANPNFLFWSAQFSYESLALPLAMLVLYAAARREAPAGPAERVGLTVVALLVSGAVVATHHLTSYFLALALLAWALMTTPVRALAFRAVGAAWARLAATRWGRRAASSVLRLLGPSARPAQKLAAGTGGPGGLALFALVAALVWLVFVASLTLTYLSPVFGKALLSVLQMIQGEEAGRQLFSSPSGYVAPAWNRVVGLGSVLLCLLGLPFGLRQVWRRYLYHPIALLLAASAVGYFGMLGLRLIPSAWEIGNRSSEFLFIGLALVLALGRLPRWRWPALRWVSRPSLAAAMTVIVAGGFIAGWPPQLRLAQINLLPAGSKRLEPAGLATARWTRTFLGPGRRIASDEANGRYLLAYGGQFTLAGRSPNIISVLGTPELKEWQLRLLQNEGVEFLVVDRRRVSADTMAGLFFDRGYGWALPEDELLPPAAYEKFDRLGVASRLLDGGTLVVYDLRAITYGRAQP